MGCASRTWSGGLPASSLHPEACRRGSGRRDRVDAVVAADLGDGITRPPASVKPPATLPSRSHQRDRGAGTATPVMDGSPGDHPERLRPLPGRLRGGEPAAPHCAPEGAILAPNPRTRSSGARRATVDAPVPARDIYRQLRARRLRRIYHKACLPGRSATPSWRRSRRASAATPRRGAGRRPRLPQIEVWSRVWSCGPS